LLRGCRSRRRALSPGRLCGYAPVGSQVAAGVRGSGEPASARRDPDANDNDIEGSAVIEFDPLDGGVTIGGDHGPAEEVRSGFDEAPGLRIHDITIIL